ncbi:MAG: helix-turn-helix transcriptional regulator [bacterium]|nr:helix-turn-helix transcriptional regulator [bacterium]
MDQVKTGKFIASLRRGEGLTQQALGERLGVSNKTVSRWENGNYMPDIDMLQSLSQQLHVSIHELLAGERLPDEVFRARADEIVTEAAAAGVFFRTERERQWKRKWYIEHRLFLALLALAVATLPVTAMVSARPEPALFAPVAALLAYAWQRHRMMVYVEHHLYD